MRAGLGMLVSTLVAVIEGTPLALVLPLTSITSASLLYHLKYNLHLSKPRPMEGVFLVSNCGIY
jgi:hypothetical protein